MKSLKVELAAAKKRFEETAYSDEQIEGYTFKLMRHDPESNEAFHQWTDVMERCVVIRGSYLHVLFDYDYPIELSRIKTPKDLLGWVHHLCGKTWMDTAKIRVFVEKVCEYRKWDIM